MGSRPSPRSQPAPSASRAARLPQTSTAPAVSPHPHQVPGNRHLFFVAAFCRNTGADLEGRGLLVAGYSWDRAPVWLPELGTCPPHDREGRLHGADWPPAAEPSGTAASGFSACICRCSRQRRPEPKDSTAPSPARRPRDAGHLLRGGGSPRRINASPGLGGHVRGRCACVVVRDRERGLRVWGACESVRGLSGCCVCVSVRVCGRVRVWVCRCGCM